MSFDCKINNHVAPPPLAYFKLHLKKGTTIQSLKRLFIWNSASGLDITRPNCAFSEM